MNPLPLVKMSDLQKHAKRVVEDVKENGYRFVVNRGNVQVVMISLPLYTEKFFNEPVIQKKQKAQRVTKDKRKEIINAAAGIWNHYGQTTQEIIDEIRAGDRKKSDVQFIKELLEWQEKNS